MTRYILAAAMLLATTNAVQSQTAPMIIGGSNVSVLRAGTEIPMKTLEELTTKGKALRVGQRFEAEVSESIMLNGQVIIPAGTHGEGEITAVRNKGMWGKSGSIAARMLYIRVGDRQIRLSGSTNDKGSTGTAGVVGSALFLWPAGFFLTGTSAELPIGAPIKAFLDEDVPVQFATGAPSPNTALLIAVPAAVPVATTITPVAAHP